jgi:hypothetical protein
MKRYPITVCSNCGTQYNSDREFCPGYQCFEPTPNPTEQKYERKYRTGPSIAEPEHAQGQSAVKQNKSAKPVEADDDEE